MSSGFTERNFKANERKRVSESDVPLFPHHKNNTQCYACHCIYLVWPYIRCLQSVLPIQSQQSCILGHSPPECLQTADLCVCNSFAQCMPFLQPPARNTEHNRCVLREIRHTRAITHIQLSAQYSEDLPGLPCPPNLVTSELFLLHLLRNLANSLQMQS